MNPLQTAQTLTALSHELFHYRSRVKQMDFEFNRLLKLMGSYVSASDPIQKYPVGEKEILVIHFINGEHINIYWESSEGEKTYNTIVGEEHGT